MEPKGFHPKHTAILSVDVAGYSFLMQGDVAAADNTLESYKQSCFELLKQCRNRVVENPPGDNLLADLASVADAMQCRQAVSESSSGKNLRHQIFLKASGIIETRKFPTHH